MNFMNNGETPVVTLQAKLSERVAAHLATNMAMGIEKVAESKTTSTHPVLRGIRNASRLLPIVARQVVHTRTAPAFDSAYKQAHPEAADMTTVQLAEIREGIAPVSLKTVARWIGEPATKAFSDKINVTVFDSAPYDAEALAADPNVPWIGDTYKATQATAIEL